jgi:predicted GIY-YIG superfamily endonuclease
MVRNDAGRHGVYVGQTGKERDQRFAEHKSGHKASKHVKKYGIALLPRVQDHLTGLEANEANEIEADLADAFRSSGIWTEGGH